MSEPTARRWLRTTARVCVAIGIAALVFWTVMAFTGHHVSLSVVAAPAITVTSGLVSLRATRSDR